MGYLRGREREEGGFPRWPMVLLFPMEFGGSFGHTAWKTCPGEFYEIVYLSHIYLYTGAFAFKNSAHVCGDLTTEPIDKTVVLTRVAPPMHVRVTRASNVQVSPP